MKPSRHGRPPALAELKFAAEASALLGKSHQEIFTFINETNLWGAAESRSGLGSELDATAHLRAELPKLFRSLKIKSIVDIPCGDFGWLRKTDLPVETYIGADIVEAIIHNLQGIYQGSRTGTEYRFCVLDLTQSNLPKVDMVLCRDCLVHFSYKSIAKVIDNLKRSGATYLLTTTFTELPGNIDIQDGDWRPLNLEAAPFRFAKPEKIINEKCTEVDGAYSDKSLGLWKIASLPQFNIQDV